MTRTWKADPTGWRKERMPRGWAKIRERILIRDGHRCTWIEEDQRCASRATDVDHIGAHDDHSDANLRALCSPHHRQKTSAQGVAARSANRLPRLRTVPKHPGLM